MVTIYRWLFISLAMSVIYGCSQAPLATMKQMGGDLSFLNKIELTRQRQFTLPTTVHIGILILPGSDSTVVSQWRPVFTEEGMHVFEKSFATVSKLEAPRQISVSVDFIVEMSVLDASIGVDAFKASTMPIDESKAQSKPGANYILQKPYKTTLKMVLIDARTKQLIDTAIISSRSGAISQRNYRVFAQQSVAAYAQSLTTGQRGFTY